MKRLRPHRLDDAAEVAAGVAVVPLHHQEGDVDVVLLGEVGEHRVRLDELGHVPVGDDAAAGRPAHRPGRLAAGVLCRPGEAAAADRGDPEAGRDLHRPLQLVEVLLELGVLQHPARLELGEVHGLEQAGPVEQEELEAARRDLPGSLVDLGVRQFVDGAVVGVGAAPDVAGPEVARRVQRFLERLLQLAEVHPHLEFVAVAHDPYPLDGSGISARAFAVSSLRWLSLAFRCSRCTMRRGPAVASIFSP